jgi:hypothetical protein
MRLMYYLHSTSVFLRKTNLPIFPIEQAQAALFILPPPQATNMNSAKIVTPTDASPGSLKLKELLKRYNVPYEERKEGNVTVIDIKARGLTPKVGQLYVHPHTGLAS